jgi:dephospho-CoA kinase
MRTIGLTGGIACGKSTVAALLRDRGVPVLDADQVARAVVAPGSPGLAAVLARFGPAIQAADGSLDRKALGALVFQDEDARRDLEGITHPLIFAAMQAWRADQAAQGAPVAVVEAALMVETGSHRRYDALLVVAASPPVQEARLMAREGMDAATARRWIASQAPLAEKLALADAVIWNDGDTAALHAATEAAWQALSRSG